MKKSILSPASALHVVGDIKVTGNINAKYEGKALESLAGGTGEIPVLLSLQ
jgi:hypothetical protein